MIQRRNIMATQTSLVAQQVRIRQWAEQIRNCQNRPKGMDVETWCTQNNLTKANYYYRLRRVRQICLDQMQDTETTAFVELPAPAPDPKKTDTGMEYTGTAVVCLFLMLGTAEYPVNKSYHRFSINRCPSSVISSVMCIHFFVI